MSGKAVPPPGDWTAYASAGRDGFDAVFDEVVGFYKQILNVLTGGDAAMEYALELIQR